jgi:cell division protein YceG involved in septum cleavage
LYPDTYSIDVQHDFIDDLVLLQLKAFNEKVWQVYSSKVSSFSKLNWYEIVILASIIEKEEKNNANKSTVA